jgi:hypothetical protein
MHIFCVCMLLTFGVHWWVGQMVRLSPSVAIREPDQLIRSLWATVTKRVKKSHVFAEPENIILTTRDNQCIIS